MRREDGVGRGRYLKRKGKDAKSLGILADGQWKGWG